MENEFVKNFMLRLEGSLSPKMLKFINDELEVFVTDYDISKRKNEIAEYTYEIIPDAVKVYLVTKKIEGKSDITLYEYKLALENFFNHVHIPLADIRTNDIRRYLYEIQKERNLGNRSLDTKRRYLNGFFQWVQDEEYITRNPMKQIATIKFTETVREPLTDEELARVRDACGNDNRMKALLEILYCTGARVSEIVNLKREDINLDTREVTLFGKGKKYRTSYLSGRAVVELRKYWNDRTDDDPHAFVGERKPHKGMTRRSIERLVTVLGEKAGIKLYPHRIRHTSATDALSHGMRLEQVQQLLGHSKPETTEIYAKLSKGNIKAAHQSALM